VGIKERRARQKSLLRQEILDAATDILVREGYHSLSMRKVAERIDYSPTAIYLHFKDRDELVFCLCEQLMAGLVRELEEVRRQAPSALVALRRGLRRYVDFALAHPEYYIATFMIPRGEDPAVVARYKDPSTMHMRGLGLLVQLVEACALEKKTGKVEVPVTSRAIWAGVHGITSLLIAFPAFDWEDPDRVIDRLITMLVDGLGSRARGATRRPGARAGSPLEAVNAVT
jgi:AcrR family transcriptional regulator